MRRALAVWTRLVTATAIAGSVALASLDTGTGSATSLAPQSTGAPSVAVTAASSRVTTTSASPVMVPLTFSVADFDAGRNLTATVTVSGAAPGGLRLDTTGLTLTTTTATGGVTVVSFRGSPTDVTTALTGGRLAWEVPEQPGAVSLSATVRQDLPPNTVFNPTNGHYYQRDELGQGWFSARTRSESRTLWGLTGYLATITSAAEQEFLATWITTGNWWIGASDSPDVGASEGAWRWVTGPAAERVQFWQGLAGGSTVDGRYARWVTNQPNNDCGFLCFQQDFAEFQGFGDTNDGWNDVTRNDQNGGLVEFGLADGSTEDRGEVTVETTLTAVSRLVDLMAYADANGGTAPNAAEWTQATISGVDTEAFAASLATVLAAPGVTGSNVDAVAKAQALVNAYRSVFDYASSSGTSAAPSAADYDQLGLGTLSGDVMTRLNTRVAAAGTNGVDTHTKMAALVAEALVPPPPPPPPPPEPTTTTSTTTTTTTTTVPPTTTTSTTTTTTAPPGPVSPSSTTPPAPAPPEPVPPEPAPLAPVTEQPDGSPLALSPGQALLVVGDRLTPLTMASVDASTLEVRGAGVGLRVVSLDSDGTTQPLDAQGNLAVPVGGNIEITGDGFAAGEPVQIWLFSTPVQLGSTTATPDGAISSRVAIPDNVAIGSHTVQLVGRDPGGDVRGVSLGITVTAAADPSDEPDPTPTPDVAPDAGDDPTPVSPDAPEPVQPAQPAQPYAPFSALDQPEELVATAVTAVAVLAAASAAGAAAGAAGAAGRAGAAGSAGGPSNTASDEVGYVEAVGALHLEAQVEDQTAVRWQWLASAPGERCSAAHHFW